MPCETSQSNTSSCMKATFLVLCVILCFMSIALYSNTTVNWKVLNSLIENGRSIISNPLASFNQNHTDHEINISSNETKSTSPTRRFAIFACSIHATTLAYSFYAPITAAAWKRVGYEAIVVFVGDFTLPNILTSRLNLSRSYLKHVGAYIIDVQCNKSYAIKLSQLIRVFSGFLPDSIVHDDDDVLTGDSDLMPLRSSEYQPTKGTDGFIFNAFCCGSFQRRGKSYRMFPMGHIYLKKKVWLAMIMESNQRTELLVSATARTQQLLSNDAPFSFDTVSIYGRHEFRDIFDKPMTKGDSSWFMDQVLCSMLLTDYREKNKNLKISERGRANRLDRAAGIGYWNRDTFSQFGDAHLIHDTILEAHNWKIFNKLLKTLFNESLVNMFNDYHRQYMIKDKKL
ncbi:unnamed protein product [Rotaria magnacalcarata]|uniref:Uncharacterized protein n=3 Tax=Rotaria magnacalcarata TaxID=392030 RepID=A0A816MX07_9BILA|nr:unnamed protein product [Rotaria magnacalcarata]CAF2148041.1 unnamed protein product [Rotaria magnacalcarata]